MVAMAQSSNLATAISGLVTLVMLLGIGNCLQKRSRQRLLAIIGKRNLSVSEAETESNTQYRQVDLQLKAELDDEGSRLYELAAQEENYEVGADGERYELPADDRWDGTRKLQELRGEEHSKELEVPQN